MTSYILGKTYQIIDLNKNVENFQLSFHVQRVTSDGGEYYGAITERGTPANEIQFQPSQNGVLTGDMTWQQNQIKDFVLILYADDVVNVTVTIDLKPLPRVALEKVEQPQPQEQKGGIMKYLKIILIVALVGLGIYWAYRTFYKGKKGGKMQYTDSKLVEAPIETAAPAPLPEITPSESSQGLNTVLSDDLMARVRKLPLK